MADVSVDQSKLPGVKEGRPGLAGSGELGCAGRGARARFRAPRAGLVRQGLREALAWPRGLVLPSGRLLSKLQPCTAGQGQGGGVQSEVFVLKHDPLSPSPVLLLLLSSPSFFFSLYPLLPPSFLSLLSPFLPSSLLPLLPSLVSGWLLASKMFKILGLALL